MSEKKDLDMFGPGDVSYDEEGFVRICKICGEPLPEEEEDECHLECERALSGNDPDGTGQDEEVEEQ